MHLELPTGARSLSALTRTTLGSCRSAAYSSERQVGCSYYYLNIALNAALTGEALHPREEGQTVSQTHGLLTASRISPRIGSFGTYTIASDVDMFACP